MSRENGTLFVPSNPFHLHSLNSQYTLSISSTEHGLQKIVGHERDDKQWKTLFVTQELVAHIVQPLKSNKVMNGCVSYALADCNSKRKVERGIISFGT